MVSFYVYISLHVVVLIKKNFQSAFHCSLIIRGSQKCPSIYWPVLLSPSLLLMESLIFFPLKYPSARVASILRLVNRFYFKKQNQVTECEMWTACLTMKFHKYL